MLAPSDRLYCYGDFAVLLDENQKAPTEMIDALEGVLRKEGVINLVRSQCGSDGLGTPIGIIVWAPQNGIYHVVVSHILASLGLEPLPDHVTTDGIHIDAVN